MLALGTLYGDPGLLFRITREDGPIEWATVFALLFLAVIVARRLLPPPSALPAFGRLTGWALVGLAIASAGEEISWGQRLFGFQTGETMEHLNLQHETNLHNLVPAELFNGIIVFSLGIGFVLIPFLWRKLKPEPPLWLPSPEVSLFMLDAILINHYRFRSPPEKIGIVVILALLAWQTVLALRPLNKPMLWGCLAGWGTAACLYHSRSVLRAANNQYEVRELLIVVIAAIWAYQTLLAYRLASK